MGKAGGVDMTEISAGPDPKAAAGKEEWTASSQPPQENTQAPDNPKQGRRHHAWAAAGAAVLFGFAALLLG
jgi:hypothetical protein